VKFSIDEFIAFITTAFFAAVILNFRNWGDVEFDFSAGLQTTLLSFLFLLFVLIITVWICKAVAVNVGFVIAYKSHILGLMIGLFICVMTNGYLPVFLPGGFSMTQPERLQIGKYRAPMRAWSFGLVAGTFPLAMLLWVMLLNPLYLLTGAEFYFNLVVAVVLFAVYACLPLPFIDFHHGGRIRDWFRYLHGASFGLDVAYASFAWYIVLCVTVMFFAVMSLLLTIFSVGVGVFIYAFSFIVGLLGLWIYSKFFTYHRHRM
jgi:hypothetical protein